jgi:hypothetical protein
METIAVFIAESVVAFAVLLRWNGVSKLIFQEEKAEYPK